jgi:hypothetical protein
MRRPRKKLKLLFGTTLFILIGLVVYFVILPEFIAQQYINRVHQAASTLRAGYIKLEESTGRAFVNDPTDHTLPLTSEVESLHELLRENRIGLVHFSAAATDYHPLPYTGFTEKAGTVPIVRDKAAAFVEQSNETFEQYDELIGFIKQYNMTANTIGAYTDEFNASLDLNVYAGQSARMTAIAEQIRAETRSFDATITPHEALAFKQASVQSFNQLADGFDVVALGLLIPADEVIYRGAGQIEAADQVISGANQEIYIKDVISSRTIKSVQELREKLELILP